MKMNDEVMQLCTGQMGKTYRIQSMELPLQTEKRLEALGLTKNTPIRILNRKGHGTMIVQVRGTRFALGYGITKNIQVKGVSQSE